MWETIDKKQIELDQPEHDADLTLGPAMLLGILFVLLLIGTLVFGAGYYMGRRGSQDTLEAAKPAPDAQVPVQAGCVQAKPSASAQSAQMDQAPDLDSAGADQAGGLSATGASSTNAAGSAPNAATSGAVSSQPQVRPALDPAASSLQAAVGLGDGLNVSPAIPPAVALMVQIAAVSHQEDADVLLNALRKRGYPVNSRREPADNLIHVRIGPFNSRDEANQWSQKLMNDGYNAIVQP